MTSIPQNYINLITNVIKNKINESLINLNIDNNDSIMNYVTILENLDTALNSSILIALKSYFEQIDLEYMNSNERKRKYDIKDYCERTILTIFGELTFKRYFYKSKMNDKSFCYLDRKLGLKKYQYFDPYIRSLVVSKCATKSISETCREINDMIGKRVTTEEKFKYLNRQSARNIILESILADDIDQELETPEEIYILADEKFIATQNNPNKKRNSTKEMIKSIVVYDGFNDVGKRRLLQNKRVFSSRKESVVNQSLDYINNVYDVNKIKRVFVMGDGAKWIKAITNYYRFNPDTEVYYCLDKFHFKQSLHHLFMDKSIEKRCLKFILDNDKKSFEKITKFTKKNNIKRTDTIEKKYNYILNNWKDIQRLYEYKMSCPMESQISHNLARLLSSIPKGYSLDMLDKLVEIRMKYINKKDIKSLYLNNFGKKEKILKIEHLNFDIFDRYKTFIPEYKGLIYNPTI
ncbi:MAG: UPF0236 family protein [Bacilli bacterium]